MIANKNILASRDVIWRIHVEGTCASEPDVSALVADESVVVLVAGGPAALSGTAALRFDCECVRIRELAADA